MAESRRQESISMKAILIIACGLVVFRDKCLQGCRRLHDGDARRRERIKREQVG